MAIRTVTISVAMPRKSLTALINRFPNGKPKRAMLVIGESHMLTKWLAYTISSKTHTRVDVCFELSLNTALNGTSTSDVIFLIKLLGLDPKNTIESVEKYRECIGCGAQDLQPYSRECEECGCIEFAVRYRPVHA